MILGFMISMIVVRFKNRYTMLMFSLITIINRLKAATYSQVSFFHARSIFALRLALLLRASAH